MTTHTHSTSQKIPPVLFRIRHLLHSYWAFPCILVVLVVLLASLGISGSSIASYDGLVNNNTPHIGPIPTKPRAIRSDEWLVNTQMTIAQYTDGFPAVNKHIGNGQDMSAVLDVPYKSWSVLFKAQNLIFFIAPLNFAFAFKWWSLAAILAFSVYALFLKLLPKQRLAASLLAGIVLFAPMIQWWYQTITILPVALGLLALTLLIRLHQEDNPKRKLLFAGLLSYLIVSFIFVLYPPFQIPVIVAVIFCYSAYLIANWRHHPSERTALAQTVGLVAISAVVAGMIVGLYLLQHSAVIHTISDTVYPGHRDIAAGGYSILHITSNFLEPFELLSRSVAHYTELKGGANQSEMSSFIFPVIPLLLLGYYLCFRKTKQRNLVAFSIVAGSSVAVTLFLARLIVPYGSSLYKLLALNLVPHNRLLIGVGFACTTLLIGEASMLHEQPLRLSRKLGSSILAAITLLDIGITRLVMMHDPGYISHTFVALCGVVAVVGFCGFFLYGRLRLALAALLFFSLVCTFLANPFQRNLNEVTDTAFAHAIQAIVKKDPNARWVTNNAVVFENYATANGAKTLSGTYMYPQLSLWRTIDPQRKNEAVYNRYAHVEFSLDDGATKPVFTLLSPDTFSLTLSACSPFMRAEQVGYVYSLSRLSSRCLTPVQTFTQRSAVIYLYKTTPVRP